jgi:hypothetical protein
MHPSIQLVTLLARRPGGTWGIRQRFHEQHCEVRAGKMTMQQLRTVALSAKTAWEATDPTVEFMIEENTQQTIYARNK